ncbi:MAG TPA: hypothetical protein VL307_00265 [Chitinophagaceae bacterium]|nr:hypothetical protein [Chitinophagaceae bacterium]
MPILPLTTPKNNINMRVFFFCLLFFYTAVGNAQSLLYDSSVVNTRSISSQSINRYRAEEAFQYDRFKEPPASWWQRFWQWFWQKIYDFLSTDMGGKAFKITLLLLAVSLLVFFIYRLTGMNKAGLFQRNTGRVSGYSVTDEDIHSIPFEQAIEEAVQNKNYRLAVRLLYLQSLKKLSDKQLIQWQLNKTNIAYLQELSGTGYQPVFDHLTRQFENNWYGDLPIEETEFSEVRNQFNQFNRQFS